MSNRGLSDLRSDALPTELSRPQMIAELHRSQAHKSKILPVAAGGHRWQPVATGRNLVATGFFWRPPALSQQSATGFVR